MAKKQDKPKEFDINDAEEIRRVTVLIANDAASSTAELLGGGEAVVWYSGSDVGDLDIDLELLAAFVFEHPTAPPEALYRVAAEGGLHEFPIDDFHARPFWFRQAYTLFKMVLNNIWYAIEDELVVIAALDASRRSMEAHHPFEPEDEGEGTFLEKAPNPLTPSPLGRETVQQSKKAK